jgi:acyl-coenzyme A thioesterase PaaI-like protein
MCGPRAFEQVPRVVTGRSRHRREKRPVPGCHRRASPDASCRGTLGIRFVAADVQKGTIDLAFDATGALVNPAGNVLGAFLAALLYDTVDPALLATLRPDQFQSTLDLDVKFPAGVFREAKVAAG